MSSPHNRMLCYYEPEFNNKLGAELSFNIRRNLCMAPFKLEEHQCLILLAFQVLFSFWFCLVFGGFGLFFKCSWRDLTLQDPCLAFLSSRWPICPLLLLIQQLLIPNNLSLYKSSFWGTYLPLSLSLNGSKTLVYFSLDASKWKLRS